MERYGDFVLLDPPVRPKTWLLWFGPAAVLAMAMAGAALYLRRGPRRADAPPLDEAERAELERILAADAREEPRP